MVESSYEILFSQRNKSHLEKETHHDIRVLQPGPEIPEALSLWQYMTELFQRQSPVEIENWTARSSAQPELPNRTDDPERSWHSQVWAACNTWWRSVNKSRHQHISGSGILSEMSLLEPWKNEYTSTKHLCCNELEFANRKSKWLF